MSVVSTYRKNGRQHVDVRGVETEEEARAIGALELGIIFPDNDCDVQAYYDADDQWFEFTKAVPA